MIKGKSNKTHAQSLRIKKDIDGWKNKFEKNMEKWSKTRGYEPFTFADLEELCTKNKSQINELYKDIVMALYDSLKPWYESAPPAPPEVIDDAAKNYDNNDNNDNDDWSRQDNKIQIQRRNAVTSATAQPATSASPAPPALKRKTNEPPAHKHAISPPREWEKELPHKDAQQLRAEENTMHEHFGHEPKIL